METRITTLFACKELNSVERVDSKRMELVLQSQDAIDNATATTSVVVLSLKCNNIKPNSGINDHSPIEFIRIQNEIKNQLNIQKSNN